MDSLEILSKIGTMEIARKTHIEPQIIGYILDKNYEALSKYNIGGYIKIIVREFDVDMSEWLAEYAATTPNEAIKKAGVVDKIPPFTNSAESEPRPRGRGLVFFGLLLAGVASGVYFLADKIELDRLIAGFAEPSTELSQKSQPDLPKQTNAKPSQPELVKPLNSSQTKPEQVPSQEALALAEPSKASQPEPSQETQSQENQSQDQNAQPSPEAVPAKEPVKASAQDEQAKNIKPNQDLQPKQDQSNAGKPAQTSKTASIKTLKKVWVGVINLKQKSKKSYDLGANKELEIDLSQPQLIACGNGNIALSLNGKTKRFEPSGSVRFLVQNGQIKQIDYDEFVRLNGGKSW